MVDTTQPATAAEFEAAGASPADAASLADQANAMAGRKGFNARVELEQSMRNQPPPAKAPPPTPLTNAQLSEAAASHQDAQLADSFDKLWQPPQSAYDYRFPDSGNLTDEQAASDNAVKTALHTEGMPKFVVDSIASNLSESVRTLANETPTQASARLNANKGRLTAMWKGEFDSNIALVDRLLEQMRTRSPSLVPFMDAAVSRLTPLDIDLLLQVAKHRKMATA